MGRFLTARKRTFGDLIEQQLGERVYASDDPGLTLVYSDVPARLREELAGKRDGYGRGKTLVFSMLTDGFSPQLVKEGITEEVLRMLVEQTEFRIRILTKNAVVGSKKWIKFFQRYPGRFVVGLSTGTLDDAWSRRVEIGTSAPSARLKALRALQEAGVPTYGMLCPIFPDVLWEDRLDELIDAINPAAVETVWAEPFNDRSNRKNVQAGFAAGTRSYRWFDEAFGTNGHREWSKYATEIYRQLKRRARKEGWLSKLKYLLYEEHVQPEDARVYRGFKGVLLQSKPDEDGLSRNAAIAALQGRKE